MAKKLSIEKKGNFYGLSTSDIINKNKSLETQVNELKKKSFRIVQVSELRQEEPFKSLFSIETRVLAGILTDMEKNDFDPSKPIDVWQGIVIDGNTRFKAALEAGIIEVPVFEHQFQDKEEALEYAIHNQRDRRNITDVEIFQHIQVFDEIRQRGDDHTTEDGKAKATSVAIGRSSEITAQKTGINRGKVEKVRTIRKHGDKKTINAIKKGELSINKAYKQVQKKWKKKKMRTGNPVSKTCTLKIFMCRNDKLKLLQEFQVLDTNVEVIEKRISKIVKDFSI